ncbi:uncharacterized protein SCHCODRAFT_02631430 [Schizophyllum commune H4-8]|nr:uncharacterized protein SCHCODRAFT_02631430 [Schizophyllum commune H4-8]KAI5890300.1 hypothetical protein SCHCODRAFT_02631430 [Schizophyllum commune H4-8]
MSQDSSLPDYNQANTMGGGYGPEAHPIVVTVRSPLQLQDSASTTAPTSMPPPSVESAREHLIAGLCEGLRALVESTRAPLTGPLVIEHRERRVALGRKRMESMSGRNAALYLKSKFGLLAATAPVRIEAAFRREQDGVLEWMEVDMDAWEELVPHMHRLIIRS